MAQLNPNFEIDFSDINSYEQIQLINDTQIAKENLLMHRAYKEPSDDEIIRNHFSSFTFVDFCPKVYTSTLNQSIIAQSGSQTLVNPGTSQSSSSWDNHKSSKVKTYELESFSDLFNRINSWLKLNKDWRVVSMQTLLYDCGSQFNHLKSSIHSNYLPQNARGLRLFLSPSKSRFSGPQKIGCINVVPRRVSTTHLSSSSKPTTSSNSSAGNDSNKASKKSGEKEVIYETLDQILQRLNELLLTRPIEGRILSVETITLPMVNGYVDTESNFFPDTTLNRISQATYSPSMISGQNEGAGGGEEATSSNTDCNRLQGQSLIDILRVYYEFGPMVCGLVNLIDFIPRFYSPTITTAAISNPGNDAHTAPADSSTPEATSPTNADDVVCHCEMRMNTKMPASESLTRLIKRSLAWFELERKRILSETINQYGHLASLSDKKAEGKQRGASTANNESVGVDLKLCNLQVHHKNLLKAQMIQVKRSGSDVQQLINTRTMAHEKCNLVELIAEQWMDTLPTCAQCMNNNAWTLKTIEQQVQDRLTKSPHLIQLAQAYQLKYVRLAYIVPVFNKYAIRSIWPLYQMKSAAGAKLVDKSPQETPVYDQGSQSETRKSPVSDSEASVRLIDQSNEDDIEQESSSDEEDSNEDRSDSTSSSGSDGSSIENGDDQKIVRHILAERKEEEWVREAALRLVESTRERHRLNEAAHQAGENETSSTGKSDSLIGQLTYRLFAPCQLVNSSSCFAINPVNSNSPLARRGSVDLNGSGLNPEESDPTFPLPTSPSQPEGATQNLKTSLGALFPSLANELIVSSGSGAPTTHEQSQSNSSKHTPQITDFESVEAIKRRMEIYVTTNSMKVVAGETLIVNLSDNLSCLSTAIEQTLVRAPFAQRTSSTWVSVYVLYAAVQVPQLPSQLLAQHKLRELSLINEEEGEAEHSSEAGANFANPVFDEQSPKQEQAAAKEGLKMTKAMSDNSQVNDSKGTASTLTTTTVNHDGSLLVEQSKPIDASSGAGGILYNSAYDRTVALPSPPDANSSGAMLELVEFLDLRDNFLWFNENEELIEVKKNNGSNNDNKHLLYGSAKLTRPTRDGKRKAKVTAAVAAIRSSKTSNGRTRKRHEDSQCSII